MVKVSIIVPVHNTEKYLRACVESILAQTLKDIEIILVENASTDNSLALCQELADKDKRIKTISLELGDLSNARNEGVKIATGDFVGFVDSDDTISAEMYEKLYNAAIYNNAGFACCNYKKVYLDRPDKYMFDDNGKEIIRSSKEALYAIFNKKMPTSACSSLVRRNIAEKIEFPVGRTIEDRATIYKYCVEANICVQICEALYYYHQYRGNIINNYKVFKNSYNWELADKEILSFIGQYTEFTDKEKRTVSTKISRSLVRQLNRMRRNASTSEEKALYRESKKDLALIPTGSLRHPLLSIIRFAMTHSIGNF